MAITKAVIQSQTSKTLQEQKFARFIHAITAPLSNCSHKFNFGPSILIYNAHKVKNLNKMNPHI